MSNNSKYYDSAYHTDDGKSIGTIIRKQIAISNIYKFKDLIKRYNLTDVIETNPNTYRFTLYNTHVFYIGLQHYKIRKQGDKEWTGKIITLLDSISKPDGYEPDLNYVAQLRFIKI